MFGEFRDFVARGNVIDLAVAVIIGGAFATITTSLTEDIIMPVVGWIFGGADLTTLFIRLGDIPADYAGSPEDYAALKEAGVAMIGLGAFITVLINFVILAFVIFLMVRQANKMMAKKEAEEAVEDSGPSEIDLLTEIRDSLKKG
ncbi:large conductance mechanosensitive channel protein MscL [Parasphingopyxis lamellibrachiae]|uniref:Large-conductance mechanosensitive channel n=1 Tax=Parasphingopyxis lamellibrachiae TaxID=680125 RepID=A0A3D9FGP4_9SPHN|nr:large conductance mechanosensitive channel protein MscL [Parasphingopyxis lamellibrachiae]RED16808.1 large conductance mechanosensitive channel [Parasphingopyxis lamellibrachiae]